jgi:hypothetical protein
MPKASRAGARKKRKPRQNQAPPAATPATTQAGTLSQRRELSPRARVVALVVGDALCFLIFASIGTNQHGEGVNLLYSAWVALPFLAAWFAVSPFLGAFRAELATSPKQMLLRTALAWLATWPFAMAFRWLQIDRTKGTPLGAFLSFAAVALLFNLALLAIWRWPFALNNNLRKRGI